MFTSRFGRRPTGGVNKNVSFDQSEPTLSTTSIHGNSRLGRFKSLQESSQGKNNQDSIHVDQTQQSVSKRNTEGTRPGRYVYNRRTNASKPWQKQPTVRQADTQVFPRNNSRIATNKQLKLQPAVIGTNTFQPPPKPVQDTHSPRNVAAHNQRRLSNVSEQPSEPSSSFCYVNQGNLPKSIGPEDFRQPEISAFSPEPSIIVTDFCAYCLNKQNFSAATHHCSNCGPFGRYLCQRCLGPHNEFTENHSVRSLSGQCFRKQSDETNPKAEMEAVKTEVQNKGSHPNFIKDVSVKTQDDEQSCQITGFCQLQNGTIVLTEMNNKAIKTLDCQNYGVTNTLRLLNYPMDICCIGQSEALVILYKSTVQYLSVDADDHIELTRKKVLNHDCICLAFCNGKIFVGSSKSLYIYDKNWTELDMITNELFGDEKIFSDQFSIAVSEHDNVTTIYIADENNGMYSIEIMGQEITTTWKFKDCTSFKASGMCIDSNGDVLLSDRGSERLIKMNAEGMILGILLDSSSGIQLLNMPFQDKKNNHLIISLSGKDIIKVFDFK